MSPRHTVGRAGAVVLEGAHPANEDGAAGVVNKDLRGVEVVAQVPLHEGGLVDQHGVEDAALQREVARLPEVLPAVDLVGQALRAHGQEVLAVDLHDVGALPHVAKLVLGVHLALDAPRAAVVGAVEQHHALVVEVAGAQQHPHAAVLLPDLGVAHVQRADVRVVGVAQQHLLAGEVLAVLAGHQDLVGLAAGVDKVHARLGVVLVHNVAGVVQAHEVATVGGHAAAHAGRARVDTVAVFGDVGHQRGTLILPMQKVG